MGFDQDYAAFMDLHLKRRKGERKRRLEEGHGNAEMLFLKNVWWPLFGNFYNLHPEYEVSDFKDGKRFLDFAYLRHAIRICFEVDGYGPHVKNISRWQFADQLERQNQLIIDGWTVIRFSYDQVQEQPRRCQQVTQQVIGRILGDELNHLKLTLLEKEVIRFAIKKEDIITPRDICRLLNLTYKPAKKVIIHMVDKKILCPVGGTQRIRSYRLAEGIKSPFFHP